MSISGAALVCGAGSGLGRAVALTLVSRGVTHLLCSDINIEAAEETVRQALEGKEDNPLETAAAMRTDISKETEAQSLFDWVISRVGRIDICVNTAGFGAGVPAPISEMSLDVYRAQLQVHNEGGFLFLRAALKTMLEQQLLIASESRHATRGSIVMMTSLASEGAFIGVGNYTAAKFAVKGLVQTAAIENARKGVRINAVAPSYVSGPMMDVFLEQNPPLKDQILGDLAMGRLVDPEEVAEAVLFLASSAASYINGHTLIVDGGSSLQLANRSFDG